MAKKNSLFGFLWNFGSSEQWHRSNNTAYIINLISDFQMVAFNGTPLVRFVAIAK